MRRPQVILVVTLALLAVLAAALPLGQAAGSSSSSPWPCCDDCGACNRKLPPDCRCNDISARGCHPKCKNCVRNTLTVAADGGVQKLPGGGGHGPVRTYRCDDMVTNFCQRRCTPAQAPAFLG